MRLLATSDIHQHPDKWERLIDETRLEKPDFVVIAGDLIPVRDRWAAGQREFIRDEFPMILQNLVSLTGKNRVILQMGNDDLRELNQAVDDLCKTVGVIMLNDGTHLAGASTFAGMNRVRDYPFGYKAWVAPEADFITHPVQYRLSGKQLDTFAREQVSKRTIAERLTQLSSSLDSNELRKSIWLIHQPPSEVGLDILSNDDPCGSPEVLQWIQSAQPLLTVHGHIHESPYTTGGTWAALVGDTICLQCGQQNETLDYAIVDTESRTLRHSYFGESALLLQP